MKTLRRLSSSGENLFLRQEDPEQGSNAYHIDWRHGQQQPYPRSNDQLGRSNANKNIYRQIQPRASAHNHAQVNFALDRSSEMIVPLTQSIASPISPSKLQGFTNSSA